MFFKVNITGCQERKGLVQVRYDLYLDPIDDRYSEHYVQVPVFPEKGYEGKVDEFGSPIDEADYQKWLSGLKTVYQHNPFCCHFCQFEPTVTDEEIIYVGELALDMSYKNWQAENLLANKNEPVKFSTSATKISACETRVSEIKSTNFTAVSEEAYKVK